MVEPLAHWFSIFDFCEAPHLSPLLLYIFQGGIAMAEEEEKALKEVLNHPLLLAERVRKLAVESQSFTLECSRISTQVGKLSQQLRSAAGIAADSGSSFYDRPLRRVFHDVSRALERAVALIRRCQHGGGAALLLRCHYGGGGGGGAGVRLRQVFSITSAADFQKLSKLLDSSAADMRWLLDAVYGGDGACTLPPIATGDPILSFVWPPIAALQPGGSLPKRTEAARELASLTRNNEKYKESIVSEGGIPPLLKLLKEGASSADSQIAAAEALCNLGNSPDRVRCIVEEQGIPTIVKVLGDSATTTKVQVAVVNLVSIMAENDPSKAKNEQPHVREGFGKEDAIKTLVTLLSINMDLETNHNSPVQLDKGSVLKMLQSRHNQTPEKAPETEGADLDLKISCAEALWRLSTENPTNCKMIAKENGLLCLAKLIESENKRLKLYCLRAVMAVAAVAELDEDFKRSAFKMSSPPGKKVFYQLLRVIQEETTRDLRIPAIKATGCLARILTAKESRVIQHLVTLLGDADEYVAAEATIALRRFAAERNCNCKEHSKAIIRYGGIEKLKTRLQKNNEQSPVYMHALTLLCYLVLNADDALKEERTALGEVVAMGRSQRQYPSGLKELVTKARGHLTPYGVPLTGQQTQISV